MTKSRGFVVAEVMAALTALAGIAFVASEMDPLFDRMCVAATLPSAETQAGTVGAAASAKDWVCAAISDVSELENRFAASLRR
ncbi:MAG TPA: hypothetical protein VF103_01835 [Polyangiaceae bacterium]